MPFPSTSLVSIEILYDYILSPLLVSQLYFVYFGCITSSLQHVGSFIVALGLLSS